MSRLIWRFYDNFYLDPWAGMHFGTTSTTVELASYTYDPPRQVDVSAVEKTSE